MIPIPDGWYELNDDAQIERGDKWCIRQTDTDTQWLPAKWVGKNIAEMKNNRYIRQIVNSEPVSASLSTPQDNQ